MVMKTRDFFKKRIATATFQQHNGNADTLGQPTYGNASDWTVVVHRWPCELLTAGGGEQIRGRQVRANTTHVLIGDPAAVKGIIHPENRVTINGVNYNITAVYDPDGLNQEYRVECRQSW